MNELLMKFDIPGPLPFIVMGVAAIVFVVWLGGVIELVRAALLWVDDQKPKGPWLANLWILRLWGYQLDETVSSPLFLKGDKETDGDAIIMQTYAGIGLAPTVIVICVVHWEMPLIIAAFYCIAHTARFARRHKKLFDKHVKDPGAHDK